MKCRNCVARLVGVALMLSLPCAANATRGAFDVERWYSILDNVRDRAASNGISNDVIDATLKYPAFIPSIVKSDKNQAEFKLTLDDYLARTVNSVRIKNGKKHKKHKLVTKSRRIPDHSPGLFIMLRQT